MWGEIVGEHLIDESCDWSKFDPSRTASPPTKKASRTRFCGSSPGAARAITLMGMAAVPERLSLVSAPSSRESWCAR